MASGVVALGLATSTLLHMGSNALVVGLDVGLGISIGSAIDASIQTFLIPNERNDDGANPCGP